MKRILTFLTFVCLSGLAFSQQTKTSIDYQYFRDEKSYFAYELFTQDQNPQNRFLMLNFTSNINYNKIERISIVSANDEVKLKFKLREETVKSDNPEQKFYPISLDVKDLADKKIPCEAKIIFKLDNGLSYTLPFDSCKALAVAKIN